MVEPSYSTSESQLRAYLKIRREKYWVKRFVVLGNGMLHYYMKPTSLKPRVILLLANTTVKDLGKQKNEYILEVLKGSNFRLLISFVNERDHKAWFEVLKGSSTIENDQTPGETKYSPIKESKMMREETQRLISSIPMIPLQSVLQQRIKEVTERDYKLVGTRGACPYCVAQPIQEVEKPKRGKNEYFILAGCLVAGMVLSRLQFDWLLATIALGIAVMVYMGASFKDNQPQTALKVAFKCTTVVYAGVGQVLTALYDNTTRTSWEPYVISVSGSSHISVTYQTKYSKVTQDISRQFIKDDDVYYLIEKNGPELKYVFKIQAAESNYEERTSVILYGSTSDSDPTIGNPEALMSLKNFIELRALVSYSSASSIIINEEESSEEELKIGEDTNSSLSSVPDERRDMINGFIEEAKRVLKDAQELMEESQGWERLNLGIPGINAARRKASGGLYVIMSQGIINRTPDDIMAYLEDISRKPEYDPMFESGRVVEKLPDDMEIAYQKYKKTGPVSARDFCLLQKRFVISDSYVAAVATSVNHPDVPDTQFVRAHLYMGCFMLEKIDQVRTKVTYMVHVDIKGSIPKFIVNKVQNGQGKVVHLLAENLKS